MVWSPLTFLLTIRALNILRLILRSLENYISLHMNNVLPFWVFHHSLSTLGFYTASKALHNFPTIVQLVHYIPSSKLLTLSVNTNVPI